MRDASCAASCDGTAHSEARPTLRVRDDARRRPHRVHLRRGARRALLRGVLRGAAPGARRGREHRGARLRGIARGVGVCAARSRADAVCSLHVDGDAHAARAVEPRARERRARRGPACPRAVPGQARRSTAFTWWPAGSRRARSGRSFRARSRAGRSTGEPGVDALARVDRGRLRGDARDGYVLDGDLFRARTVKVEAGPVSLSTLRV